jgi:hypothetical protein
VPRDDRKWKQCAAGLTVLAVAAGPGDSRHVSTSKAMSLWDASSERRRTSQPLAFFEVKVICFNKEKSQWDGILEKAWGRRSRPDGRSSSVCQPGSLRSWCSITSRPMRVQRSL